MRSRLPCLNYQDGSIATLRDNCVLALFAEQLIVLVWLVWTSVQVAIARCWHWPVALQCYLLFRNQR
jgi:hypothetical protein